MVIKVRTDLYSSETSFQNVANNQEDPVTVTIKSSSSQMMGEEKGKMVKLKWSSDIGSVLQAPAKKLCSRVAKPDEEAFSPNMEPRRSLRKEGRRFRAREYGTWWEGIWRADEEKINFEGF